MTEKCKRFDCEKPIDLDTACRYCFIEEVERLREKVASLEARLASPTLVELGNLVIQHWDNCPVLYEVILQTSYMEVCGESDSGHQEALLDLIAKLRGGEDLSE